MIAPWTIGGLLRDLTARGAHPAVILVGDDSFVSWSSKAVAERALSLAYELRVEGIDKNGAVALWAPNSPAWIAAALGVLASGRMLVPIDDLADAEQFEAALNSSGARLILTTARHFDTSSAILRTHHVAALRVDEEMRAGKDATLWPALADNQAIDLAAPADDAPAILSWTSGTTGSPKAFLLTHRNIATNVEALQQMAVVGRRDRALLPLPLHHAYPFVVGMLDDIDPRDDDRAAGRHDRAGADAGDARRGRDDDHRGSASL